jgi:hypothetical protein
VCSRGQQIVLFFSALKGLVEYGKLLADGMDLILKGAPEEQRRQVQAKKDQTSEKMFKDLETLADLMSAIYV